MVKLSMGRFEAQNGWQMFTHWNAADTLEHGGDNPMSGENWKSLIAAIFGAPETIRFPPGVSTFAAGED
jgi:hypothetical protein